MKRNFRRTLAASVGAGLALAAAVVVNSPHATASQSSSPGPANQLPSAVPSAITPAVNNGSVQGIAQVGTTMVIGGDFTQVGGLTRTSVAAFNKTTGALSSFAPNVDGVVKAVLPGPTATTAYIGGTFTHVNGAAAQFLALLDLTTGNLVTTFTPPAFNFGYVNDMVARGTRLYVGGTFSKAGGKAHGGLVALNATTGALDPFMNVQLTDHHNDSGSGAQGWIGPWDLDVNAAGTLMIVIGNFKHADGLLRDQVVMIDLTGATAQVNNWATNRYSPYCFNWAFDAYVRGVSFSPDGSYFVINATGGGNAGTLCDAVSRFDTNVNDSNAQPTWVDETGGDTVWGVTVTNSIVYVGGHNRWLNNPLGSDQALPGALPRGGLAALDPITGRPFAWNPGRRPLGAAVYAMLATPEGLWIGSDTDWIGNRTYKRPKIAFFPYTGGYTPASTSTASLPGTVFLGGSKGTGASNVLFRVDAGGPAIQAIDNGPDWAADTSDPSPYRNNGSNAAGWSPGATINSSVPSTTPSAVFNSERWSPSDNPAMNWAFPVAAGTHIEVRLYFANRCTCTSGVGQRQFNVKLDGTTVLNHYDIVADVGDQTGEMKKWNITSDGTVNIDFSHYVENPLINGIEIINTDLPTPPPGSTDGLSTVAFDGTTASGTTANNQGIDFGSWRGAFLVGNKVYYGYTDSNLYARTFDGATFGPAVKIDPYNDPYWSDIDTDDGTTFRGMVPTLYGQMPNVTGMAYSQGRLYYTLFGDSHLYSRWFLPDSGVLDERTLTSSSSVDFSAADGMFISGGKLYYASSSTGNLSSVAFSGGTVSGAATLLSGPGVDGVNWKNRALFLAAAAPVNQAPTAAFTSSCTGLTCSFNASGSSDTDGTISSYSWNFGDGSPAGSGVSPSHPYAAFGTYHVTLTVTDNQGATGTVVHDAAPANSAPSAAFTSNCAGLTCSFDASGSSDSDGTISSYSWDFGDGSSAGSGVSPTHPYSAGGTYHVTLTVTDNSSGTGTVTHDVNPATVSGNVQFVGAVDGGGGSVKTKQVTMPSQAAAGNTALLFLTQVTADVWSGPSGSGWTQAGTFANSTLTTTVWTKTLGAGDLGGTVAFTSTAYHHASINLAVYSGVDTANPIAAAAQSLDSAKTSHVSPTATAGAGDLVVSFWAGRATATRTWTTPAAVTLRNASADTGTLTVQAVISDSNAPVPAGSYGGLTATTDGTIDRAVSWTIVLNTT
jgi:PKD repeat protein